MNDLKHIATSKWQAISYSSVNVMWQCVNPLKIKKLVPFTGDFLRDFVRDHIEINWEAFNG